ncbi:MAG: hypothetical protein ACLTSZ_08990 [Lachnospiraceae bacterium]
MTLRWTGRYAGGSSDYRVKGGERSVETAVADSLRFWPQDNVGVRTLRIDE